MSLMLFNDKVMFLDLVEVSCCSGELHLVFIMKLKSSFLSPGFRRGRKESSIYFRFSTKCD